MRRSMLLCVAICVAMSVAFTTRAADEGNRKESQAKTGIVKKVDLEAKNVVVMVKRELTFSVTAETRITQGDAEKTLADIKVGDTVTVDYAFGGNDNRVATKIAIAPPKPLKGEREDK